MPLSTFKQKQVQEMKDKAVRLYQQGLDTRTVAKMLKELHGFKRSHTWVWEAVKEHDSLSTPKKLTKTDRRVK
ncbi:MAG: hypothetical protein A3J07_02395 [Candidatus Doudnabacteria bacterium RIFCSPLOWO2_02_FULL_49_13]|jgi:hypothetical protein|uniref:Transposase n=1 Tax=Candidatus Doudnabacteria bacterium RIFCSPHIGHO2_12_FULL_48_16 TaxID=1817838 RepID=A0A1F5PKV2_9BACT|nr:hypothetical protein [Candidatus Spechtbacteria bacterium]MDD5540569.1 hypothetical protein [Candidatus Neomarinimicrobiota bacterium]OGE90531.1 MAG: hypothetical protein A3E29_01910 [Candidatus Doudnabacteria bacterium RIFCSPHIGHO2_12_FULL_48_16]OGE97199.1 MAG: hypothetical protein A2990_01205 [Candidatus Doudnabacteria bacterium RIFCSPLOWO2_01_FULL_49_40]OGF02923.1 MAG: hypothetical protein A3J07_02395 [Candidatus Doudnabacteria bacterium RIFCSPLOWO2_02_FULL_49_13]